MHLGFRRRNSVSMCAGLAVVAALAAGPGARAQVSELPQDLQDTLTALGANWGAAVGPNIRATVSAFEPLLKAAPKDGVQVTRDIAYGPHARHRLDLYKPEPKPLETARPRAPVPVVIFVHGGSYVSGDKNAFETMYANVAIWFARQAVLAVNATYRLAPEARWPAAAEDVAAMVAWARANAAAHGGDPNQIFLVGHSAGATHVAAYVFDKRMQPPGGPGVKGAVLISGRYRLVDVVNDGNARNIQAYFGADPATYATRSPISHIADSKVPVFVVIAEHENPTLDVRGAELFAALCARDGTCPRFLRLDRHNHMSGIAAFNTPDEQLGRAIIAFMGRDRVPPAAVKR